LIIKYLMRNFIFYSENKLSENERMCDKIGQFISILK
jgi:hypothetical protein